MSNFLVQRTGNNKKYLGKHRYVRTSGIKIDALFLCKQSSSNSVNDANNDESEYALSFLADIRVERFDTGARRSHRLSSIETMTKPVTIVEFNATQSAPLRCGLNNDDKWNISCVADIPSYATLLCAHAHIVKMGVLCCLLLMG